MNDRVVRDARSWGESIRRQATQPVGRSQYPLHSTVGSDQGGIASAINDSGSHVPTSSPGT